MLELWIIALAVLLTLFHPELTESSSNCFLDTGTHREIQGVKEKATAFLSCPPLPEDEKNISISLHKEGQKLHSTDLRDKTQGSWQRFQVSSLNSSVSYMILKTEVNDTGLYSCHTGNGPDKIETILLITEQQPEPSVTCPVDQTQLLTIICSIMGALNLILTLYCFCTCKLKNTTPHEGIYMNTKPGGFRRR